MKKLSELNNLTFIVTDDCNFNCAYCFQKKEKKYMTPHTVREAVDFFHPFLKPEAWVGFYGGEPLLAFDRVQQVVDLLTEKGKNAFTFALTTNGSLLDSEKLEFFNRYRFALTLSFDGTVQDQGRKPGSLEHMPDLIRQIREHRDINFEVNSVFTPATIGQLADSMELIIGQGPPVTLNLSSMEPWTENDLAELQKQMNRLVDFLESYYKREGQMPVKNFEAALPKPPGTRNDGNNAEKKSLFLCSAARDRMALAPDGTVWGCFLFHDYFKHNDGQAPGAFSDDYKRYCFGGLREFIADYPRKYPEPAEYYSQLRQDFFRVGEEHCFLCPELAACVVCPVNAAYSTSSIGKIPPQVCRTAKIRRKSLEDLRRRLKTPTGED